MKVNRAIKGCTGELPASPAMGKQTDCGDKAPSVLEHRAEAGCKWALNGCPRCGGDVFLEIDEGEVSRHCLQCGFIAVNRRRPG